MLITFLKIIQLKKFIVCWTTANTFLPFVKIYISTVKAEQLLTMLTRLLQIEWEVTEQLPSVCMVK